MYPERNHRQKPSSSWELQYKSPWGGGTENKSKQKVEVDENFESE